MRSQKKATQEARREWATAVAEDRVLRLGEGTFRCYPTTADRDAALAEALAAGYSQASKVVPVPSPYGSAR